MKKTLPKNLEKFRVTDNPDINRIYVKQKKGDIEGFYMIPYGNEDLAVIVGCGASWDHVSVSLQHRTPNWEEMNWIKNLFFEAEELVIQFHPPQSKYINVAETVLHLWRPWNQKIELPPDWMVK